MTVPIPEEDFSSHGHMLQASVPRAPRVSTHKPIAPENIVDVRNFGATGDGVTIDSPSINRAIESAAALGGGTIYFPAGVYACYSIHLKSKVSLYLDGGAVILAAETKGAAPSFGYDLAESNGPWESYQDFGHNHWQNSLLWGENLHDLSICGSGRIWGKGLSKGRGDGPNAATPGVANKAIALKSCRNVLLRDFSILQGGHFGILATGVNNLTVDNITIDTNRDGIDIDCCQNVRVLNCVVNAPWDDGICLKSSYGLGQAIATENVTISNCTVSGSYELGAVLDGTFRRFPADFPVARQSRIKLGTESNGAFRNITISNCIVDGCKGLALESVDGALLEDIVITNISMRDVTDTPIFLRLGRRMRAPKGTPVGCLKRVIISNVVSYNCIAQLPIMMMGVPGYPVEDIRLNNIYLHHKGGVGHELAQAFPPEQEDLYPEANRFGPIPAQGAFIRHAKNIVLNHVDIASDESGLRPGFVLDDVSNAEFSEIKIDRTAGGPIFELTHVTDFRILSSRGIPDTEMVRTEKGIL